MDQVFPPHIGIVLLAVLVTAATDLWKYKVYNVVTLPLLACGLIYHSVVGGSAAATGSVLGAAFGFSALFVFYLLGGMGAGDVKLMSAVGAWLGMVYTFYVFIAASLAAGIYAVVAICWYRRQGETWVNLKIAWLRVRALSRHLGTEDQLEAEIAREDRRGRMIPYAAMVAIGLVATVTWSWLQRKP